MGGIYIGISYGNPKSRIFHYKNKILNFKVGLFFILGLTFFLNQLSTKIKNMEVERSNA